MQQGRCTSEIPMLYRRLRFFLTLSLMALALAAPESVRAQGGERPADTTRRNAPVERVEQEMAAPAMDNALAPAMRMKVGGAAGFGGGRRLMRAESALGATIGGAQDIGYARKLIEAGKVPQFIDFSPEGLFSEHDIPTPASSCDEKLCLSLGYGYAPTADDRSNALFVHLGLSSSIRADEFHRQPLQLAVVIDKSGSMLVSMSAMKQALRSLVRRLNADDEIVLVEFNNQANLLLPPARVGDTAAILAAIDQLQAEGGTNIEAGLQMGFESVAAMEQRQGVSRRVMLFTDAMPNVGRTDSAGFRELTQRYAGRDIGLTAFGVGIQFGQDLVYHISQLRGGNSFYLESPEKIARVFDEEFEYLVTPIVYDLKVRIATPPGLKLKAVYGLPTWTPGDRDAELFVPTVFLSSNRGAIVLRYERDGEGPLVLKNGDELATGTLGFTDIDGREYSERAVLRHEGRKDLAPGTQFYTHEGMRMAVALTNVYFGLRDGCLLLTEGKKDDALDAIARAQGVAALENVVLADEGLASEIRLLEHLARNIQEDATLVRRQEPGGASK